MTENYKIPKEWHNFGDINPKRHGGLFVKWDRDMWQIIKTTHYQDLPNGMTDNEFMFEQIYMEPMDIWKDGKPENGFTDWAIDELENNYNKPFTYNPTEIQEESSMSEFMDWVLKNHGVWLIGTLAFGFAHYYSTHDNDFEEDYWSYLQSFGIEKEDF